MIEEFAGVKENELFASKARQKVQKAIITRLNRSIGIDKKNGIENGTAKILLDNLAPHQLEELLHILSPIYGMQNGSARRVNNTAIAMQPSKKDFSKYLRGVLIDAMNIFNMSRKSKELFINAMIYGNNPDSNKKDAGIEDNETRKRKEKYSSSSYYFVASLARENFYLNMKDNSPKFPEYKKIFAHLDNKYAADALENILNSDDIDIKTKQYVEMTIKGALQTGKYINSCVNAQINDTTDLNSTPFAIRGHLSKYAPEKGTTEDYSILIARVIKDVAEYTDADQEELKKLFCEED